MPHPPLKKLLLLCLCLAMTNFCPAQSPYWQWLTDMGSLIGPSGGNVDDELNGLAVDEFGNTYVGAKIYDNFRIGSNIYSDYGFTDGMITSLDCRGNVNWTHIIGGGGSDVVHEVITLPGFHGSIIFGSVNTGIGIVPRVIDSLLTHGQAAQSMFMTKLDSAGNAVNMKIFGQPSAGSSLGYGTGFVYQAAVAPDSTFYIFGHMDSCEFLPGVFFDGGFFLARFNANLDLLMLKRLSANVPWGRLMLLNFKVDPMHRLWISIFNRDSIDLNGQAFDYLNPLYVWDSIGNQIWREVVEGGFVLIPGFYDAPGGTFGSFTFDQWGNAYVGGGGGHLTGWIGTDTFKSQHNTIGVNFLRKYNSTFNLQWMEICDGPTNANGFRRLETGDSGSIYVGGSTIGTMYYGGDTIVPNNNSNYIVAEFDTGGRLIWHQQINSVSTSFVQDMATDAEHNLYVAGEHQSNVLVPGHSGNAYGGRQDLFVAVYGQPYCCDSAVADFAYQLQNDSLLLSDSSINATSWSWDFGDGTSDTLQNPLHIYALSDTYHLCLIASNDCSSDTLCDTIAVCLPPPASPFDWSRNGLRLNLSDTTLHSDSLQRHWTIDTQVFDSGRSASFAATTAGSYELCLLRSNACGRTDTFCSQLTLCDTPSVSGLQASLDSFELSAIHATPLPGGTERQWLLDGLLVDTSAQFNLYLSDTGEYELCLLLINSCGYSDTFCQGFEPCPGLAPPLAGFRLQDSSLFYNDSSIQAYPYSISWWLNNSTIDSSASGSIVLPDTGFYDLCAILENYCGLQDSACLQVVLRPDTVVSIGHDDWEFLPFSVLPNPTSDELYIQLRGPHARELPYRLLNLQGKILMDGSIPAGRREQLLQLGTLPDGIYLLRLDDQTVRVVKQ